MFYERKKKCCTPKRIIKLINCNHKEFQLKLCKR